METKNTLCAFSATEVTSNELEPINLTKVGRNNDSDDEKESNSTYIPSHEEHRRYEDTANIYNRPDGRRQMMPDNQYNLINKMMDFPEGDIDEATLKNIKHTSQYLLDAPASHYASGSPRAPFEFIAKKDYSTSHSYGCYAIPSSFQNGDNSPLQENTSETNGHIPDVYDTPVGINNTFHDTNDDEELNIEQGMNRNGLNGFRGSARSRLPRNRLGYETKWQMTNHNQEDIMRAAKALFSKKTRTLYHWMYPTSPKFQLKTAVSMAWDAMPLLEKQFYVSQVLEKNGCSQNRLMINPQLGYVPTPKMKTTIAQVHDYHCASTAETDAAVNNLLLANASPQGNRIPVIKKRGRPKGATSSTTMKMMRVMQRLNRNERRRNVNDQYQVFQACPTTPEHELLMRQYEMFEQQQQQQHQFQLQHHHTQHLVESKSSEELSPLPSNEVIVPIEENGIVRGLEASGEEFNDDPELRKEFEMYQLSMNMNN